MSDDIDERIITWDSILKEVIINSEQLVKDLLEGIKYIAAAGILIIALGSYVLFIGLRYGKTDDPIFLFVMIVVPGSNFLLGLFNLHKYIQLRSKYSRLFDIQKEIKK
jgi:hypothetical protein